MTKSGVIFHFFDCVPSQLTALIHSAVTASEAEFRAYCRQEARWIGSRVSAEDVEYAVRLAVKALISFNPNLPYSEGDDQ